MGLGAGIDCEGSVVGYVEELGEGFEGLFRAQFVVEVVPDSYVV